ASAMASPTATASAYPSSVSTVDGPSWVSRSRGESTNTRATCQGVGRMNGWTWKASTPSHQTASRSAIPSTGSSTAPGRPLTRRRIHPPFPGRARGARRGPGNGSALGGQVEVDHPVRGQPGRDRVGALHQRDAAGDPLLVQGADRGTGAAGVHVLLHQRQLAGGHLGVLGRYVAVQDLPGLVRVVHGVLQRLQQRGGELLHQIRLLLR